ncbi:hypothetical protein B7P43_G07670 [Cryptotermes secundus]|uniref:Uncharacterized protein n=1 Tax=Cryptotermes secundus TaxID=105785 RepID=A0A2J7RJP2_9NEOP|nr:hypothetical protein B7P43_G07670 [Cryptotermes secundus]
MKHLAMCKRKKCSVCAYTKATFGDYTERGSDKKQLLSCFQAPLQDLRNWIRPVPLTSSSTSDKYSTASEDYDGTGAARGDRRLSAISGYSAFLGHSSPFPSTRSEYSFRRAYSSEETETQTSTSSPSPSPSLPIDLTGEMAYGAMDGLTLPPYISYIDEVSTSSSKSSSDDSGHGEELSSFNILSAAAAGGPPCHCTFGNPSSIPLTADTSLTSASSNIGAGPSLPAAVTGRAFSSDSGFSSELYDTAGGHRSTSTPKSGNKINATNDNIDKSTQGLHRSKWTASFRKLINRVSKR